ncbi:hypothetical protein CL619_05045 [archaeon]|nr:hypothetical protein [archaeon]|tara:strand:- start:1393 stop:1875 length:483 start_codon:yes stop_codon:yes gene_type:complete
MKVNLNMRIRKATKKDFFKLNEMKKEFFLWECEIDDRLDPNYINNGLGSRLSRNLNQSNVAFFVAEEKENFLGFVGVDISKLPGSFKAKKQGHLFNLYVRKKYRNNRISTQLIRAAMEWLDKKGINDQIIKVHFSDNKAHKIYRKKGFKNYLIELQRKDN